MSGIATPIFVTISLALAAASTAVLFAIRQSTRRRTSQSLRCPECGGALPPSSTDCLDCAPTPRPLVPPGEEVDAPSLVGLGGPVEGQIYPIAPASHGLAIGRHPDSDVFMDGVPAVSRHHAQVVPEGDEFVLYDRDSANGTTVNGVRVFRHVLANGDRVHIGGVGLRFEAEGSGGAAVQALPWRSPAPSRQDPRMPDRVGGYSIEEILGHGGMSVVYRGRDQAGRLVAIKVLNFHDDYIVRKFAQEQAIGELLGRHPYIRQVEGLGRDSRGRLFLTMEYVAGRGLRRLIGQLTTDQIVRVVGQTCLALAYAHERNVVHRDIKPENILIDESGTVRLTDFGIARFTSSATMTTDRVVGTPEYLSPEQARCDERVGPACDIYSLGIVLYELLTGRVPFPLPRDEGDLSAAVTVLRQHLYSSPPTIHRRLRGADRKLAKVALQALEKDPGRRYATAGAMAEALGYHDAPPTVPAAAGENLSFVVRVASGPQRGHELAVVAEGVTIGRADLDPADTSVSRRHAFLSVQGGRLWVEDVSLNGTRVNGERVFGRAPVVPGDRIQIGSTDLILSTARPTVA